MTINDTFNSHAGKLLVSLMPLSGTLSDLFHRSVVLVLRDNAQRASGVDLAHRLDRHVLRGGAGQHGVLIFRNAGAHTSWMNRIPQLPSLGYMATFGPRPTMEDLNREPPPTDQRFFSGSAQWGPDGIRNEIAWGCWHALDADEDLVWNTPAGQIYDLCLNTIHSMRVSPCP